MRSLCIASVVSVAAVLVACNGDEGPTGPSNNASMIAIVANSGAQSFSPNPASIGGQMATWRNSDGEIHRIVANDGSFDTGNIAPGDASAPIAVPGAGTNYHCSIHPTMVGSIGPSGGGAPPPCMIYC